MRGKKGTPHNAPDDPPRRRANKRRGHGTYETDRPPVFTIVGRTTSEVRLYMRKNVDQSTCQEIVTSVVRPGSSILVSTDQWSGYARLKQEYSLNHHTVCHSKDAQGHREWARDDDDDGRREVHCNSCEGLGAAFRTYLRTFRGVHKDRLAGYCASFQTMYNAKRISPEIIQKMCRGKSADHANCT